MPILSHKLYAYYIKCVVKNKLLLFLHFDNNYHKFLRFSGSNPVVGSSKNTIRGSPTKLIATDNLRFMPPDNCLTLKLAKSVSAIS
jgi:hypothetical protein